MGEKRYIISEASDKTGLEAHVLRYWEEELSLKISRNEMGHRYYTVEDIERFKKIKELKDKGYQLKAIKNAIETGERLPQKEEMVVAENKNSIQGQNTDKMEQFKAIIGEIVTQSLKENNEVLSNDVSYRVNNKVIKEMDYLLRMKEDAEEERYKKLDETIRNCQRSSKETAAYSESKGKKKRRHFLT